MVAIFTGAGTGFERGSGSVLGGSGLLGSASFGRSGEQVFLNAANGNLLINRQDEFLVGRGPDAGVGRTYNSLGNQSDDNGDNWLQSTDRRVFGLTGTLNSWGSTIKRRSGDGSEISYGWDGTSYVATDGAGSFDRLSYNGASWTWTDGDSRVTESYAAYGSYWRITSQSDTSGNSLTFGYTGDKLTTLTTANGETLTYTWSGNHISAVDSGDGTLTRYYYDGYDRLSRVDIELTGGGSVYSTSYTYHGSSKLVASISETDGSYIAISYDGYNRVISLAQTVAAGVTRTTTLYYSAGYTDVTDPTGAVTRLEYANGNFAAPVEVWGSGNVDRQPATIDGHAATQFTVQVTGNWTGISHGINAAAGETITFGLTLQAVGVYTTQDLGLYGDAEGWGSANISSARIVSGPGQIEQLEGGIWRVSGLSSTTGTRVEITRTFKQAQTGGAYIYVDNPGGYRAGMSLVVADAELTRSMTAVDPGTMTGGSWYIGGVSRAPAGTLDGSPAYQYTVTDSGWAGTAIWQRVNAGDRMSYSISLQAVSGGATSQTLGLWGESSGWGLPADSTARIISGPGTLSRTAGGLWTVDGLSTSQATRIEIVRTYDRAEVSGSYLYFDYPGGFRVGQTLIAGAPYVVRQAGYDAQARQLTKITTAYGTAQAQTVQFGYNANGDLTSVTDGLGNTTSYTYDANGNQLTATDRLGNVVTRTYSATNQLLTETRTGSDKDSAAAAHTTRYVYDSANRLVYTVSAEGQVTRNWYDGYGQLYFVSEFPDHRYDLSGLAANQAPSQSQLDGWCAGLGDTASSQVTYMLRDARGNLTQRLRGSANNNYASYNGWGGYTHEYYTYDSAGRLLSSVVAGQNTQYYVYDGLNRLVSQTDVNGGTTSIVFADTATQTVITLANGFVQTSTYNKAGELISFTESGDFVEGGTAQYGYDKNGRLRMMADATGRKFYYLYDKAGRKVADIVENGETTEYRYDANGRLVATVHYMLWTSGMAQIADLNSNVDIASVRPNPNGSDLWTWSVYDKEGRLIEAIEGDGSVTAYEYDASGRLVKTTSYANRLAGWQIAGFQAAAPSGLVLPASDVKDSVARIFYDKDGRKIGALDGEGYLTRTIYDGSGRKVQEIAYANITSAALRASGTLQNLIDSAGTSANDRSTRYVYDGQDLLRFTIDALNHVTEYVYEDSSWLWSAFGPVRQTTRYAGAIGALSSYSYASVKSAVAALASDPANRTSYAVYDSAARLAYSIDAGGAVVGYSYDSRGQMVRKVEYATLRPTSSLPSKGDMDSWVASYPTANDRVTRYYYSARGELRFAIDAEGYVTRTDYDAEGRVSATLRWDNAVSANDGWTIATVSNAQSGDYTVSNSYYDVSGRLTLTTNNAGLWHRHYYYANGLLAWDILSEGGQDDSRTYYVYDAAGRKAAEYAAHGTAEQAITTYTYNGLGDLIAVSDPNAHTTSFEYDHAGRVIRQANAYGSPTVFEYNAFGEVTRTINARGFSTYSEYDQAGRVTSVVDALNYTTTTRYTAFGEVASVTRGAAVTSFGYDKLGRAVTATDAEGGIETSGYDAFGNRIRLVNKLGGITDYSYDRRGLLAEERVQAILDGSGNVVTAAFSRNRYEYDARGNVVHRIEAYGLAEQRDSWFEYDKANRLTSKWGEAVSVGLSQAMATPREYYRYDTRGNLVETIDANGARTLSYYDDLNRKVAQVTPAGTAGTQGVLSTFAYDAAGNLTASRTWATLVALPGTAGGTPPGNPGGAYRETVNSYDALDRLKTTSVANQSVGYWNGSSYAYATGVTLTTSYDYDVVGNVVRTTGPDGAVVHSYYDALDRKTAQVDAGSWLTTWSYDAEGNVLSEWRYAGQATGVSIAGYGAPGTQGDDRVTNFAYDKMGRRIRESRWLVETWSLNAANGQLVGGGGRWADIQYSYNALGEVRTKTEATGDVTTYSYDNAGRLIQEARPGFNGVTPTVRYQYNGLGQLTVTRQGDASLSGNDRISTNLYDGAGRLTGVSDALGQTRSYYYDAAGRKVGEYYTRELGNGGSLGAGTLVTEGISYQYDLAGNVVRQAINTIAGGSWSEVSSTQSAYDAFGAITARGTNGGWQEQFRYDTAGHLVASNAGDGVWRIHAYDKAGRQTLAIESNGSTDLSALSQADAIGLIAGGGVTASATVYDGRGQAVQAVQVQRQTAVGGAVQNIATARGYTAFGELAWETDAYGRQTDYSYNTMGRVTQIQRPSVSVTAENGTVSSTRPTERMFYDISGRLIGTQDANSVWTGSGVKTTRQLLAGTGYGDGAALMVREWHPDGGIVANSYDVFGDQVDSWDALNRHTSMAYDKLGRLTQVTRPATAAGTLVQSYAYDVLGNRIGAWNNAVGYAGRERTQYDALGRITLQVAFGGDTTTTSYGWDGAMATSGLGTFGGWVATSSYANGMTSVARTDLQGRLTSKTDLGGHVTSAGYDLAGRMTSRTTTGAHGTESASYAWLNNGQIGSMSTSAGGITTTQSSSYDLSGNKLAEYSTRAGVVIQNATATYDALNRLVTWSESGSDASITPAASSTYEYDANSNVMRTLSSFRYLDQNGAALGFVATKDDVYRYDTMNRMVRGGGVDIAYDVAGQRVRVATWSDGLTWTGWRARAPGSGQIVLADDPSMYEWQGYNWTPAGRATYSGQVVETYSYTADGQLDQVWVSAEQASANGGPFVQANGTFGPAVRRAAFAYDLQGRLTGQTDYEADGTTVAYSRSELWYDAAGRLYHEMQVVRQGADTLLTYLDTGYGAGTGGYALGAVTSVSAVTFKNGSNSAVPDTLTTNGFAWFDGAVQASVAYKPDASGSSVFTTSYGLSAGGLTNSAYIADGRPREVRFVLDAAGQAIRRDEADNNPSLGDPHQLWYRFNGREMGNVTNDNVDAAYLSSIASRQTAAGTGAFRNGALTGGGRAVFGEAYRALTSYSQGGAGGSYEAQGGETLEGVAAQLWGDGALWYRLAEANGLSVSATLVAGQRLTIPAGVMRSSNSAATFKPYDPAEALGSLSPTTPKPAQKGNKCGALGAILMIAIAVAVTALTRVPFAKLFAGLGVGSTAAPGAALLAGTGQMTIGLTSAASIAGGVAAGVAGSVASQAFGVAAGIQDKFSWKGVALAGISAGVAAGLAGSFDKIAGSPFLGDAVRGALGSAIGQGIGVATGLQSKFDFAGVAAAGLGMAVSGAIGLDGFGGRLARNTAGGLANAAARSLLDGTSFGDNILAALPDIIGQTVGDAVAGKVAARNTERRESLSGIRASTATEGASDLGGGDLFRLIVEAARQMLGLSDEASIVVTGQRESWRDIAYGPVENRFADLLQQQRITSTLSLRDQVRRFDGYRRLDGYQSPPARPPGTSISSAPRGALGYGSNVVGSVGHYVQGLTASTLKSIVSSGGNTGQMFRDAIGNGSHAATAIVSETLRSLYPDNDDMFSAQARAANNARHPFLLDPNHVSSNAEKRGIIAATVVSLVGARGMGVRGGAGAAKTAPIDIAANEAAWARAAAEAEGPYSLVGANRAVIDPRKLTDYALNPAHPVGGNKARVFESAFGFNSGNADNLMLQLREGVMSTPATIGKIDQYGTRFTADIPVRGPTGSGSVRTGWIYRPGSNTPELTTLFPK